MHEKRRLAYITTLKERSLQKSLKKKKLLLYDNFKANKIYKEMIKNLKTINKKLGHIDDSCQLETFADVIEEYTADQKAKERNANIDNIKRINIYNKQFHLGSAPKDIKVGTGDIVYYVVRKNCDCFTKNRTKPTKRVFEIMIGEYVGLNGGSYENGEWLDKKGKKIKPKKILDLLNNCILAIYNCSENLKLYSLN